MQRMLAAQDVRRAFLRRMLIAPTARPAKAMTNWTLARLVNRDSTVGRHLSSWTDDKLLGSILGVGDPRDALAGAPEHRHPALAWAVACAAYEAEFPKDAWRHNDNRRAAYLAHPVWLGYTPCDTEQLMIDRAEASSDDVDDDLDDLDNLADLGRELAELDDEAAGDEDES